jgi:hypothetical protein
MTSSSLLRQHISNNADELVIFGADNFAQFPRRDGTIQSKCERALAGASENDVVVLRGRLDSQYYKWLRSHDLGPGHVVEYKESSRDLSLSERIVKHPEPILDIIEKTGRKPVYVPWYSGKVEAEAASRIGAELFGATGAATLKYNDKSEFKTICQQLDIPVVTGHSFSVNPEDNTNASDMASVINLYLRSHKQVIIRGTVGESGMSLYRTDGNDLQELYEKISSTGEKMVIIEPFLSVISSPGDQWVIDRSGDICHLGITDQICERGMVHVGTQYGLPQSARLNKYISQTSHKVVQHMSEYGYRGVLGIDYIVTADGLFPVENNARFNGSTYVRLIVENIEKKGEMVNFWKFIKIKTNPCSFLDLVDRLQDILYDGTKQNSVFPYNCNALANTGDFAVILLAEDFNHLVHLEKLLSEQGVKRN